MLKLTTVASVVLLGVSAAGAKAPPVRKVVVFGDRAEVTRVAEAACAAGRVEVAFPGLPATVDGRTLRGVVAGPASVVGVTSRARSRERQGPALALESTRQAKGDLLEELEAERRGLAEESHALAAYEEYLRSVVGEEMRNAKPDTRVWAQALDTLRDRRQATAKGVGELDVKRRALARELAVIDRQLERLGGVTVAELIDAAVVVDCSGAARVEVGLAYVLPGATWRPDYDLRVTAAKEAKAGPATAELVVSAVVQQATGEDWDDVVLSLSTAKPRLGAEAPQPAPLYVAGFQTAKGRTLVQAVERRAALVGAGPTPGSGSGEAELADQGQSFALTLARPVTVKADGRPYWMPIDRVSAPAEVRLVAVPKLRPYVYQAVQLVNPARYALLNGVLHTYRRGGYVGDSRMAYRAAGEPIEASLGVDEELKVVRAPIEEQDKSGNIIVDTKLNRAYRITVTNNAKTTELVEVRENVPVSKLDEVRVEILEDGTTAGYQLDGAQGFVRWRLTLAPGEKKSVDLRFRISVPSDWAVGS